MDERELGSDGEDILCVSGTSSLEDDPIPEELELDMNESQFNLFSSLPVAKSTPWHSTSATATADHPTFETFLAGNLNNGTIILSPDPEPKPKPEKKRAPKLGRLPSCITTTLDERIQSEIENMQNYLDLPYEEAIDILARRGLQGYATPPVDQVDSPLNGAGVGGKRLQFRSQRRDSDASYMAYYTGGSAISRFPVLHLSDEEEEDDAVQVLQNQVDKLVDSQATNDDKYSKVRSENVTLSQRIHELEEQIREMDHRSDEKLNEEQKRHRDLIARMEREKQLEIENYSIRLQSLERDYNNSTREVSQLRSQNDRLKSEKNALEQELFETQQNLSELRKEFQKLQDSSKRDQEEAYRTKEYNEHYIEELSKELESLKSSSHLVGSLSMVEGDVSDLSEASLHLNGAAGVVAASTSAHIHDLEEELKNLRQQNSRLKETNDELEAVLMNRSIAEGKKLVSQPPGTSIEMELRNMDDSQDFSDTSCSYDDFCQLRTALKDQQDVNLQLRNYIDGILMNIIDKYPELLEVRK